MATRLYRFMLYLFPGAFRVEYGDEMESIFRDRLRDASGVLSRVSLWLDVIPDLIVNALRAQVDVSRQDLRATIRSHVRAPGFALTVVAVVAVGVGATTAVFSITDHALVRPLPFAESHRLVKLWENVPRYSRLEPSPANYRDWKRLSTSFSSMAPLYSHSVNLLGNGDPVRLDAVSTRPEAFSILGVAPAVGRSMSSTDVDEDATATVLISFGFWQGLFGGANTAIGETLRLDGVNHTIVGVMPRDFYFPNKQVDLWLPKKWVEADFEDRDNNYLQVLAKLEPGVSLSEARAEMDVVTEQLEAAYPDANRDTRATVVSLRDMVSWQSRSLLIALAGAALCVLLIVCTNLTNLFLTRGITRLPEMTVRTALGGGRERLLRQTATETAVLCLAGGGLGVLFATLAVPLLTKLVPVALPMGEATALDPRVLGFALVATVATAFAANIAPTLSGASVELHRLKEGARGSVGGGGLRVRRALVVVQVGATVVLLVGAGLLIRALVNVRAIDPGFESTGVVAASTPLPAAKYEATSRRAQFYESVIEELAAAPGVSEAAYVSFLPMVMRGGIWPVEISGDADDDAALQTASLRFVTKRFFATMGIPLLQGRDFDRGDTEEAPDVAVVSASFAARYWPDGDPLGKTFAFAFRERLVVGVVGDISVRGLEQRSEPQVYLPHRQVPDGGLVFYAPRELVVRGVPGQDVSQVAALVRTAVRRADDEVPIAEVRTLASIVDADTSTRSTQIAVLGAFASLALFLSAIGIYGLLAFGVAGRRTELGVRIALGARTSTILMMVLREGAVLAAIGSVVGAVVGYACARAMVAILAGVDPASPAIYAAATGWAIVMTLAGSLVPAVRATRVDPIQATRID